MPEHTVMFKYGRQDKLRHKLHAIVGWCVASMEDHDGVLYAELEDLDQDGKVRRRWVREMDLEPAE